MDMMYKINGKAFDYNNKSIIVTIVLNLFGVEYYTYHIDDDDEMVHLTIYMCNKDPIKVIISKEDFDNFEEAIKLNMGFFTKK